MWLVLGILFELSCDFVLFGIFCFGGGRGGEITGLHPDLQGKKPSNEITQVQSGPCLCRQAALGFWNGSSWDLNKPNLLPGFIFGPGCGRCQS